MLEVKNLTVHFGSLMILDQISFQIKAGQWLMLVGPNGAGKSTIVNAISRGVPYSGAIFFEGTDLSDCKPAYLARRIGILTQNHSIGYSFTVEEVVRLGRYAHSTGLFSASSHEDTVKTEHALEVTGMLPLRNQSVLTLSGGELQRTFLAQVFAQDPKLLILDEPTNHLDLIYQKQLLELIQTWVQETGRGVISVVHDLNLAKAYGSDALLLHHGKIASAGSIDQVLTPEHLEAVYSMDVYQWMRDMLSQWTTQQE